MRGKGLKGSSNPDDYGITPAHAGKSTSAATSGFAARDHPRACGEKRNILGYLQINTGSPPRMRGKEGVDSGDVVKARITPAHAGKSVKMLDFFMGLWDHPRACGEKWPLVAW